jgi:hypothetical protein
LIISCKFYKTREKRLQLHFFVIVLGQVKLDVCSVKNMFD